MSTITQTKAMINQKRETALFMARQGFHLLPLLPKSKFPYSDLLPTNAFGAASWTPLSLRPASEPEVKFWFEHDPLCNYGIITGANCVGARCLCVVDVDRPRDIPPGLNIPPTVAVKTARGSHFYYYSDTEVESRKLPFGELKASSGYVVGPGSVHETGVVYEFYDTMAPSVMAIAELPTWASDTDAGRAWGADPIKPLETQNLKPESVVRKDSITCYTFSELLELAGDEDVALEVMRLCGREVRGVGKAFSCPLPGHDEKRASAALWKKGEEGLIMLHDFHRKLKLPGPNGYTDKDGNVLWWPLPDVYAALVTGKGLLLKKGERAIWWIRALHQIGRVNPPLKNHYPLPTDTDRLKGVMQVKNPEPVDKPYTIKTETVKKLYDGFVYLMELRQLYGEQESAPFSWTFAADWCGIGSMSTIQKAMHWLLQNGYLYKNIKEGKGKLTLFSIGRPRNKN